MYNELYRSLEQKMKNTHRIVEKLQNRAASVEQSIGNTKISLAKLEEAFHAKDAPLQLCTWRMEQREKRPLREQVRDPVEAALEEEKHALVDSQRKLAEACRKTKQIIAGLESKASEINNDLDQKQQALSVDEMCLRTTHRSWQTVVQRTPLHRTASPADYSSPSDRMSSAARKRTPSAQVAMQEGSRNEVSRLKNATSLCQAAAAREEIAKEAREENSKIITRTARQAGEAVNKAEKMMQERIGENQAQRKRLCHEIEATQQRINVTKDTLSETKVQLKNLNEPIELASTCASWRKQRATNEHILDTVSTSISEHQGVLLKSHEELRGHRREEKANLQDLTERRERLKEDFKDKTTSLHIDLNCLTHEVKTLNGKPGQSPSLSKHKLNRAMKVDPNFVAMPSVASNFACRSLHSHNSGAVSAR
jgi:chromosome segregation ATPase